MAPLDGPLALVCCVIRAQSSDDTLKVLNIMNKEILLFATRQRFYYEKISNLDHAVLTRR